MHKLCRTVLQIAAAAGVSVAAIPALGAQSAFPTLFGGPITDPAFANGRPIRVALGGGVSVPAARFKDRHDLGFHADASVIVGIRGLPLRLRPEFSFAKFRVNQQTAPIRNLDELSNTELFMGSGNIEVSLYKGFYGMVGAGRMSMTTKIPNDLLPDAKGSSTLFNGGFGYRFVFARVAGYLEARIATSSIDEQKFGYGSVRMLPFAFGFVF